MYLFQALSFAVATLVASSCASPSKRQGTPILQSPGSIAVPSSDGTAVFAGETINFSVGVPEWNHCHPGYTPVSVYILAERPTTSSLNATYQFGEYLSYYGDYLVNNFPGTCSTAPSVSCQYSYYSPFSCIDGLPNMGIPPPTNLTIPDVGQAYDGQDVYLAVIETIYDCPVSCNSCYQYSHFDS